MRSCQVMHYGRRTTPTKNELAQTMGHSFSLTSTLKRRTSISLFPNEKNHDVQSSDDKRKLFRHRKYESMDSPTVTKRNISPRNIDLSSRRLSFQRQETIDLTKPAQTKPAQTNLRNFYIFFFFLFIFIMMSLVYSFIRMIKNFD